MLAQSSACWGFSSRLGLVCTHGLQTVLLESAVVRNKILLTAFSTVMWGGVVYIRSRFGRGLWTCPAMAVVYVGLTFVAFGLLGTTGSMGAHLVQGGSALDPLWNFVGFRVGANLVLNANIDALIAIASAAALVIALVIGRRYDLFSVKLGAETCQRVFKWDEPKIVYEAPEKK